MLVADLIGKPVNRLWRWPRDRIIRGIDDFRASRCPVLFRPKRCEADRLGVEIHQKGLETANDVSEAPKRLVRSNSRQERRVLDFDHPQLLDAFLTILAIGLVFPRGFRRIGRLNVRFRDPLGRWDL